MYKVFSKSLKRGFTLIELLVVIAIIGILAAIVLVALGNVRQQGGNAGVGANLSGMRTSAELFAQSNGQSYDGFCASTGTNGGLRALNAARAAGGATAVATVDATAGAANTVTCHDSSSAWAAEAPLAGPNTQFWCVDSNGFSGTTTVSTIDASEYDCND